MKWTGEAEEAVSRVPFFVRKRVRKRIEEEAAATGSREVTIKHVKACQKRYMSNMEEEVKGHQVEACFGPSGCPNRAFEDSRITESIEKMLSSKDLRSFLKCKVKGPLKMHHEFRISVSDCPNACSRPQIADIGLIGAASPQVSNEPCTECVACVEACREDAICLKENGPVIDYSKCLNCGKCIHACPAGTLKKSAGGWRILVGGKLGRHPQLGRELDGIFSTDEALAVVEKYTDFYMANCIEGERFGEVINRVGFLDLSQGRNRPSGLN